MSHLLGQAAASDPTSYSPLAIVASVVAFLLWRLKSTDANAAKELDEAKTASARWETKYETLQKEYETQRSLKHAALNREARAQGILDVVERLAPSCTCNAFDPIKPLLDGANRKRDFP